MDVVVHETAMHLSPILFGALRVAHPEAGDRLRQPSFDAVGSSPRGEPMIVSVDWKEIILDYRRSSGPSHRAARVHWDGGAPPVYRQGTDLPGMPDWMRVAAGATMDSDGTTPPRVLTLDGREFVFAFWSVTGTATDRHVPPRFPPDAPVLAAVFVLELPLAHRGSGRMDGLVRRAAVTWCSRRRTRRPGSTTGGAPILRAGAHSFVDFEGCRQPEGQQVESVRRPVAPGLRPGG
jgi:hypothetical protein